MCSRHGEVSDPVAQEATKGSATVASGRRVGEHEFVDRLLVVDGRQELHPAVAPTEKEDGLPDHHRVNVAIPAQGS
jgi:hypothetical protein